MTTDDELFSELRVTNFTVAVDERNNYQAST